MPTIFQTERLTVRHFTSADADNYFGLQGNPLVMQYIRPARTREESDHFLQNNILTAPADDYKGYWAVEDREKKIFYGCFVIIPIPDDPDKTQLGYSFLPEHWGNGYATEVTKAGLEYFRDRTPLNEIYGVTESLNTASQKVLLKSGFALDQIKKEGEKELKIFIVRREDGEGLF